MNKNFTDKKSEFQNLEIQNMVTDYKIRHSSDLFSLLIFSVDLLLNFQ